MNKKRRRHRGIDCRTCQNGQRNSRKIWCNEDLLEMTVDLCQPEHQREKTISSRIFTKIQSAKYASIRKLQEQLADEIHTVTYSARPSSAISLLATTESSMKLENRGAITGVQLLCKICPLNGFRAISAERKHHRKGEKSTEVSRSRRKFKGNIHRHFIGIWKSL